MIIVGITTTRCVLQREPSMTYGNHPQQLLTCTLITTQPERKEVPTPLTRQEPATQAISTADTNISQVTPLLGTTPRETSQL